MDMWLKGGQVYDIQTAEFNAVDILVEDGEIKQLGKAPDSVSDVVDMSGQYLLPGFIDCHVHICVDTGAGDPNNPWKDALPGTITLWAAGAAKRMLYCGITTAREVGGWDYHEIAVREAINAGWIEGPRLFCAGRILTQTTSTTAYFSGMYEECDGADAVRQGARKQLAKGADLIKIMASGAMTSTKYERADAIQFRPDEIRAAVEIAKDNYTHVAAHAHATEAIKNAAECGCRSVEHGSYGTEEVYNLMRKHGTFLVPTVCVSSAMLNDEAVSATMPKHIHDRYTGLRDMRVANISLAHKMGVKIAMGTDVGTPGNHAGDNMQEPIMMATHCGMSPAESIYASTINPARLLGREDSLGSIELGKFADIIAVKENPLDNIEILRDVNFVMKEGIIYKHR
ncbi:MAG: imidazolonepropionase-like amidohydrolase [Gammaproteobacteria bacterium]|jgi:imidazolonepropionase-like amidohydrolase